MNINSLILRRNALQTHIDAEWQSGNHVQFAFQQCFRGDRSTDELTRFKQWGDIVTYVQDYMNLNYGKINIAWSYRRGQDGGLYLDSISDDTYRIMAIVKPFFVEVSKDKRHLSGFDIPYTHYIHWFPLSNQTLWGYFSNSREETITKLESVLGGRYELDEPNQNTQQICQLSSYTGWLKYGHLYSRTISYQFAMSYQVEE